MSVLRSNGSRVSFIEECYENIPERENEESIKSERSQSREESWDAFQTFPSALKKGSMQENKFLDFLTRLVKVLVYLLCFSVVLFGGVVSILALLFGVSRMKPNRITYCTTNFEVRGEFSVVGSTHAYLLHTWSMLFALVFPDVLTLCSAVHMALLRSTKVERPHWSGIIVLFVFETLNCIGTGLLVFYGLGQVDSIEATGLLGTICCIPAILNLLSQNTMTFKKRIFFLLLSIDILAVILQIAAFVYVCVISVDGRNEYPWILPLSMILISTKYWGNIASERSSLRFIREFSSFFNFIISKKHSFSLHLSIYRILLFFSMTFLLLHLQNYSISYFFTSIFDNSYQAYVYLNANDSNYVLNFKETSLFYEIEKAAGGNILVLKIYRVVTIWGIVMAAAGFLLYHFAKFSYKTHMHVFGFVIPINLVTSSACSFLIALTYWKKNNPCNMRTVFPDFLLFDLPNLSKDPYYLTYRPYVWTIIILSQIWITRHCLWARYARLAPASRIFWSPNIDGYAHNILLQLNYRKGEEYPVDKTSRRKLEDEDVPNILMEHFTELSLPPPFPTTVRKTKPATTRIYACATMWHEERAEMNELIGSILRLDRDQCAMRVTQMCYGVDIEDYYELETHIFFDDAFCCMHKCETACSHDEDESQVNSYVLDLLKIVEQNVKSLRMQFSPPVKYPTPYGGRFEWILPGKTKLSVHLKDKNKIRHRKRWSQVMYMYYLLGHRLMAASMEPKEKEQIAENTFILTLDGDIDFQPEAVKILLDLMKKDRELGAACGRIHPTGKGPMVWFQKFEYAIGHWLQKSTEHTIGCVLCSPGCFSLFRAKALMRHNVVAKYATRSTEPRHYVQYDQGEDRWLCTLVLQAGCRVEYSAASDAYTHAPEKFKDLFIQRRRWIPSTVANIFDLLGSSVETRKVNKDITWLYICYQWVLMGSTILGPGTIFLMMVGAAVAAFRIDNWTSFSYNLVPILIFIFICCFCKEQTQLLSAQIVSGLYALVMVIVLVGIMLQIAEDGFLSPSTLLFFIIAGQFVVTGLLHPKEWNCLLCGVIYYITVPAMYMILIVYSIFNVHNVTWGTREKKSRAVEEAEKLADEHERQEEERVKGKEKGKLTLSLAKLFRCQFCIYREKTDYEKQLENIQETLDKVVVTLNELESVYAIHNEPRMEEEEEEEEEVGQEETVEDDAEASSNLQNNSVSSRPTLLQNSETNASRKDLYSEISFVSQMNDHSHYLISPHWLQDDRIKKGNVDFLSNTEEEFWKGLIEKYLYPLDNDTEKQKEITAQLLQLRNEYLIKFFMINALFVLIVFLMQLNKDTLHLQWPLGIKYNITFDSSTNMTIVEKEYLRLEPIGCLFIAGFFTILVIQFLAMLVHRFNTFMHIMANVSLDVPFCSKNKNHSDDEMLGKHAEDIVKGLQRMVETETAFALGNSPVRDFPDGCEPNLMGSFETIFKKKLDESNVKGFPRFISTRLPRKTLEAFRKRRSKVLANRFSSEDAIYENGSDLQRSRENFARDNPCFTMPDA